MNAAEPTDPRPTDPRGELEAIAVLIGNARRTLAKGGMVELGVLETRIGALCERVLSLPRAEGIVFAQPMEHLIEGLDRLGADIASRLAAVRERAADSTGPSAG